MKHLDEAINKLKKIREEMVVSKSTDDLMEILINKNDYDEDYFNLVKKEITKRTNN